MATLSGNKIKDTYPLLLKVNTGIGANLTTGIVEDGDGTASVLQLSTTGVKSTGTLEVGGLVTVSKGSAGVQALFTYSSGLPTIAIGNSSTNYNLQVGYNVTSEYGYIQSTNATSVVGNISINPSGGNVGIGTSNPTRQLFVNKTAIFDNNGDGTTSSPSIAIGSTNVGLSYISGGNLILLTGAAERMRIDSSGNVGIGTSSPAYTLNVNGTLGVSGVLSFAGNTRYGISKIYNSSIGDMFGIEQVSAAQTGTSGAATRIYTSGSDINNYVSLGYYTNATTFVDLLKIVKSGAATFSSTIYSGNTIVGTTNTNVNTQAGTSRMVLATSAFTDTRGIGFSVPDGTKNPRAWMQHITAADGTSQYVNFNSDYSAGTTFANWVFSNGNVGIGMTPSASYQLDLSTDNARKLTSTTWATGSDERLKENIEFADLSICYDNIKKIALKRFHWKENLISIEKAGDRNMLGWIAQEVESVFPKAVTKNKFTYNQIFEDVIVPAKFDDNGIEIEAERIEKKLISEDVIEDCRSLNADQIFKALYGAVQHLIAKVEALEAK